MHTDPMKQATRDAIRGLPTPGSTGVSWEAEGTREKLGPEPLLWYSKEKNERQV